MFVIFQTTEEPSTEIKTVESTTILDDGSICHTVTAVTKTTVVQGIHSFVCH